MRRSIAVVVAGRGLTILWVFATAQVMCLATVDEESAELYRAISENKIGMVTQMINNKGLEKASRQLHMSPLRAADMNLTTDDDNDEDVTATATEEQKQHCRPRPRPRVPAYMAPEVDDTGTGERPVEISQAKGDLPVFGNVKSPSTNYNGQEFGDYPRSSNPLSERPRGRRAPAAYVAPEVDNTGTGEWLTKIPQTKENLSVFGNAESQSTNYNDQEFGDYPRSSNPLSERPRGRRAPAAYAAPEVDNTRTGEWLTEMLQPKEDLPVFGNVESPSTNYNGQEFGDYPRSSNPLSERPRVRRVKSQKKRLED